MSSATVPKATVETGIHEADVAGFAAKLEAWCETLPPGEQAVLLRLLACAEGAVSEECEVEGYAIAGIGARVARILATGLLGATLAAPLAAPIAASAANTPAAVNTQHPIVATPEQIIESKAAELGTAFTGKRVSQGLEHVADGVRILYQNCDIYYSPATGAHEVHGAIRDKYNYLGGDLNLGLPTCDEQSMGDGKGRYSGFGSGALIVWHPNTGPMLIEGPIKNAWINSGLAQGPLGYPTSDWTPLGGGAAYSDFQNDVRYWDGSKLAAPVTAGLSAAQMQQALRVATEMVNFAQPDNFSIFCVSDTGNDFLHSRNRMITIRASDSHDSFEGFQMQMDLLLYANKEKDGSTSLQLKYVANGFAPFTVSGEDSVLVQGLAAKLAETVETLSQGMNLIVRNIPASVNVLSFKVLSDGGIILYLQPGGNAQQVAQQIQSQLIALASFAG